MINLHRRATPAFFMKKILFICSRNQWRSPTAEAVCKQLYPNFQARSAGTSRHARRTVTIADIQWADKILVMEEKHKSRLQATFPRTLQYKEPLVLNIPDQYTYMNAELIKILQTRIADFLSA